MTDGKVMGRVFPFQIFQQSMNSEWAATASSSAAVAVPGRGRPAHHHQLMDY